ncbi:MAG: LysM peptidoglycan-binding domain-containing protein [Maricaulaceae bacterium]
MPIKKSKFTIGIIASLCLVGAATAQDQTVDDRFKPRVYGSLSVAPAQISHETARISGTTASRNVVVRPLLSEGRRVIPTSSPTGSYSYSDVEAEAQRVIAFQQSATPSISEAYTLEGAEYNVVPQERRYQVELFEPAAPIYASTTTTHIESNVAQTSSHYVNEGETLYGIAKRYNTNVAALKNRNNITTDGINIGQTLIIPNASNHIIASTRVNNVTSQPVVQSNLIRSVQPIPRSGVYGVLPGDSLWQISKRACVTVEGIQARNGLGESTNIAPGDILNMPAGHCLN